MRATFPAAGRPAVIPVERPTVPNAEADSKMLWDTRGVADGDEDERAGGDREQRDQADRERLPLGGRADPAAEDVDLGVAPDLRPDHEQEQRERRHLDPAPGRRAARRR